MLIHGPSGKFLNYTIVGGRLVFVLRSLPLLLWNTHFHPTQENLVRQQALYDKISPHQVTISNFDAAISFTGKADFRRTRHSEFKKIQRSMWAKVLHPSGRAIRGNLHAKKSLN